MAKASELVYQLKIQLKGTTPPIWRRIQVPADTILYHLHHYIQMAMGWDDGHPHEFVVDGVSYGEEMVMDDGRVKLGKLIKEEKVKFLYLYDFGDNWEHVVTVEKILPREAGASYPRCLAGKRACPPDDCGGVWGYAHFLEAIADKKHPDHKDMLEWCDGVFDPERFDVDEVNAMLAPNS